jgi:hypothetical protein
MEQDTSEKKQPTSLSWEDDIVETAQLACWRDSAFHAAVDTLRKDHGTPLTVMRTGEAFGRGLFEQQVKEKSSEWSINEWLQVVEKDVLKPLGTEFTFTRKSPDVATTFLNRNPLTQFSKDSSVESLFNFGVMRGLFLSAFPKGELLMKETAMVQQPEFILKTHASVNDRVEAERIIHQFNILKKNDGV